MLLTVPRVSLIKNQVMVFEKGYHGGVLSFSSPSPMTLPHKFVLGRFNDVEYTRTKIDDSIGVIIVEQLQFAGGLNMGTTEFLQFLRDEATRIGAVLIFDEVVTSRLAFGGLQSLRGINPDMTTLGKHFGGGFSFGAFGGKREIMSLFDPSSPNSLYHSGTWNNNIFSMSAGVVGARLMSAEALTRTNQLGNQLRNGINEIFGGQGTSLLTAVGFGSLVGLRFESPEASILPDLVYFYMLENHIYIGHRGFLSLNLTHGESHIKRVLDVFKSFHSKIRGDSLKAEAQKAQL